jgi:hypothetical protein
LRLQGEVVDGERVAPIEIRRYCTAPRRGAPAAAVMTALPVPRFADYAAKWKVDPQT